MRPPPDCRPAVGAYGPQGHVSLVKLPRRTSRVSRLEVIPTERRVESFADDLNTRRGIVSGRVALLPRSTEIQPFVASIRPSPKTTALRSPTPCPPEARRPPTHASLNEPSAEAWSKNNGRVPHPSPSEFIPGLNVRWMENLHAGPGQNVRCDSRCARA